MGCRNLSGFVSTRTRYGFASATATREICEIPIKPTMEKLTKTGIIFYCVALAGVGIHQFFYADFCLFVFPHWPNPFAGYAILVYVFNVLLIAACIAIIAGKKVRTISLISGGVLLLML